MSADDMATPSDRDLAGELAAGKPEALAELFDRYGQIAYSLAVRILRDPARAEDVVQEVFLKIWQRAAAFDPGRGSLRTWMLAAVRNRCIDNLRGAPGRDRLVSPMVDDLPATGPGSNPWQEVARSLEQKSVREALASLPAEQRRALELAYYGGYSQREIGELEGLPLSTVKGRTRLALEKLHSYLKSRGTIDDD